MAKEQRGGVFTLGDVGELQETGSWNTASDVWLIGSPVAVKESPFGYFGGGVNPATIGQNTNIRRIDYSNDDQAAQFDQFKEQVFNALNAKKIFLNPGNKSKNKGHTLCYSEI